MTSDLTHTVLAAGLDTDESFAVSGQTFRVTRREFRGAIFARAQALYGYGVEQGDRVAICLPKCCAAVEFLLACLSRCAVAVPIDARNPVHRISQIIKATTPKVFLATPALIASLPPMPKDCVLVPIEDLDNFQGEFPPNTPIAVTSDDDLALILMSSGSTGVAKGICITHGNLNCFVRWAVETFSLSASDRFVSVAPLHFDLSLFDIFASQAVGASVHLLNEVEIAFPSQIAKTMAEQRSTVLYTVPTILQMMQRMKCAALADLRWVLFAGEVMPPASLPGLFEMAPNSGLANLYGPTETNVVSCHILNRRSRSSAGAPIPIGQACSHSQIDICDRQGNPLEEGQAGEICVTGPTVMQGYWQLPSLTQAARLHDRPGTHRTGDLGRRDPDGTLHFLGRIDQQVKIRGNRIDLAEIEYFATQSGMVCTAVAIEAPDSLGNKIVLHVQPLDLSTFDTSALARHLADHLPKYSLPASISAYRNLPLTLNGKINRRYLSLANSKTAKNKKSES